MEEYDGYNCPSPETDVIRDVGEGFKLPMGQGDAVPTSSYPPMDPMVGSVRVPRTGPGAYPRLTDSKIKKFIEAKCWINGTYLDSLDTEYLVNCKNFAQQRLYDKWYWKYFFNLVNEEIVNRDVAVGPKRFYPGTENIPRRGGGGTRYSRS